MSKKGEPIVHGYKGFNADMACRDFQYEAGKTYTMGGRIELCDRGFHFCRKMADVFTYYGGAGCRYAEVEAIGEVIDGRGKYDAGKSVTDRIRIVRELTRKEALELMYAQSGVDFTAAPFPADDIIRAREDGTLGEVLPSGAEFPVQFANGEKNILVVGRDERHTYLIPKYLMAEPFAMNEEDTNMGGWPACGMRRHVQEIYGMLPENIREATVPMHVTQITRGGAVDCGDRAFLLSAVNVFGKEAWDPGADCGDAQIDIFRNPTNRAKRRPGASGASWWWLRSAYTSSSFYYVISDGSFSATNANTEGGVVVGFCIESRA